MGSRSRRLYGQMSGLQGICAVEMLARLLAWWMSSVGDNATVGRWWQS